MRGDWRNSRSRFLKISIAGQIRVSSANDVMLGCEPGNAEAENRAALALSQFDRLATLR